MNPDIATLMQKIRALEGELEAELAACRTPAPHASAAATTRSSALL
jgi:hypothetical protein